jgi:hypothetical protein
MFGRIFLNHDMKMLELGRAGGRSNITRVFVRIVSAQKKNSSFSEEEENSSSLSTPPLNYVLPETHLPVLFSNS